MSRYEEFIDKKFGKLTVIKYIGKAQSGSPLFECKCECGNTTYGHSTQLRNGLKKSCGCLRKEYHYEYKQQISDLEAKLAESEEKVKVGRFWHSAYEGKQLDYDKLNNDYNKQEKLLSEVLADRSKMQLELDQLKQQLAEKDQDKISFAIEILDRVSQEFSMRVGISDNNMDTLNDIMEEMVTILKEKK